MSRAILPEPPAELKQLSRALSKRLRAEILNSGPMPFSRFMHRALYEPGLGYYSAGLHKFGASGDFVTAPGLGELFAACLARQVSEVAGLLGDYDVLEVGAGAGDLCAALLRQLPRHKQPGNYFILETSADLKRVQRECLAEEVPNWSDRVIWLDEPPSAGWRGVLIANEVVDALAAERFRVSAVGVEQMCVVAGPSGFEWTCCPAPADLAAAVRTIEADLDEPFAEGYCSEIRPRLAAWLRALTSQLESGLALFIDYGYPRREYYMAERTDGTLMCHYRHHAHDDVFFWPGLQDITAWVDFTALAEAADSCGLEVSGYANQAMFLLGCGLDTVLADRLTGSADADLPLQAEARQLTLPGMMGERFGVMGLVRSLEKLQQPLVGFSLQDLRYRL